MKVLGIGEVMLDKVTLLDEFPEEGTKVTPKKIETSVGGSAVNALVMLSKLGVECTLIAGVADDDNGQLIRKKLKNEKINLIPRSQKHSKTHTVIVSEENGSRTVIKDNIISAVIKNISKELIDAQDLILFDRHVLDAFQEISDKKDRKTKTLIDTSIEVSPRTMYMLEHADYPIIPVEVIVRLKKDKSMNEVLKGIYELTKKTFIVTLGGDGVLIYDGAIKHVEPYSIKVVDTLGAGDIFRGAFAYGIMRGWSLPDAVEFGNLSAALQCTRLGGVSAVPTKEEIYEFRKVATKRKVDLSYLGLDVKEYLMNEIKIMKEDQYTKQINISEFSQ